MKERGILLVIACILFLTLIHADIFLDNEQNDFDAGIYNNTEWNGSSVVLSGDNLSGNFISRVFDAGSDASWNNINYLGNVPNLEFLFCVDGGGDVYKSTDLGMTWSLSQEDYGRTIATEDMFSNTDYLYLLSNAGNEIWRSPNGTGFSLIYNDFDGKSPLVGDVDNDGNLYVATGPGEVWKSSDNGVSWIYQGDANGGATNDPKGLVINSSDDLFVVDATGDVYFSINDGVTWIKVNDGYGGSTGTDGLESDSNGNLYILLNYELYKSSDSGISWQVINDSFTPYGNVPVEILVDLNDNIFILDAIGRIFKSTDFGINWNEIGDCNNGATNDPKGITNFVQSTSLELQVRNCSQSNCSDGTWQSINLSDIDLVGRYFQYEIDFSTPDSSITPELYNVSIDYDVLNSPPTIKMFFPQNGATYGYNESIALNFTANDIDNNIDSCWYNLDGGNNVSILDCQNTSFNVTGDGSYTLNIYMNDTQGEEASDSSSFSVQVGAPTIELNSPIDIYIADYDVTFRYIPVDVDLDSCELWGDFLGNWSLNQMDINPVSEIENTFNLNLSDGTYLWNIKCNDSLGNSAINGNKTFYVDTINPQIILTEPKGTKKSRTVTLEFNVSDKNLDSCWYNVYRGVNLEISNTGVNCSLGSASFSVTVDADFVLNFYVNDSAENLNSTSSGFSVDTSSGTTVVSGGGGSGGGTTIITTNGTAELSLGEIQDLIAEPGDIEELSWSVKNTGTSFLNDCKIKGEGGYSSWISSNELKNLAAGEKYVFSFNLNIPRTIGAGQYSLTLSLVCQEISEYSSFVVEILEEKFIFDLIKVERELTDTIKIFYSLEELSGSEQNVELQFLLFGLNNEEIARVKETNLISANSKKEFEILIPIDSSLEGELNLLVNLNSEAYSTFTQENIVLGAPIGGLAIFGDATNTDNLITGVLILLFLVFAFFIVKRILSSRKKLGKKSKKLKNRKKIKKRSSSFFKKIFWKLFPKKDRRGIVLVDSKIIDVLKNETSNKDCKGKYVKLNLKTKRSF